jgi:hypothetical protein
VRLIGGWQWLGGSVGWQWQGGSVGWQWLGGSVAWQWMGGSVWHGSGWVDSVWHGGGWVVVWQCGMAVVDVVVSVAVDG